MLWIVFIVDEKPLTVVVKVLSELVTPLMDVLSPLTVDWMSEKVVPETDEEIVSTEPLMLWTAVRMALCWLAVASSLFMVYEVRP